MKYICLLIIILGLTGISHAQNPIPIPSIPKLGSIVQGEWYVGYLYSENLQFFGFANSLDCLILNISFSYYGEELTGGMINIGYAGNTSRNGMEVPTNGSIWCPFAIPTNGSSNAIWLDDEFTFVIVDIDPVNFSWMVLTLISQNNLLNQAFMISRNPNQISNLLFLSQKSLLINEGFPINSTNSYYIGNNKTSQCSTTEIRGKIGFPSSPPFSAVGIPQSLKRFSGKNSLYNDTFDSELFMYFANPAIQATCITSGNGSDWQCFNPMCSRPTFMTAKSNSSSVLGIIKGSSSQPLCGRSLVPNLGLPFDLGEAWIPSNNSGETVIFSFPTLLVSYNWSNPTKNLNNYTLFEAVLVQNLGTNQTFHVLSSLLDLFGWTEAARSIEPFPKFALQNLSNAVLAKIVQCTSFSIYSTNEEKVLLLGTYRDYPNKPYAFQPILQFHNVPNTINQVSSYVSAIRNIKCLNCTFVDVKVTEIGTRTILSIVLSATLPAQQTNQLWRINNMASLDEGALSMNFSFHDQILFAVQGINYDETEGLFVASATQLYWFNQSDESHASRWHNLSLPLESLSSITFIDANSAQINPSSYLVTGIPCLLIGVSNGSLWLFYWTGPLTYSLLLFVNQDPYLPDPVTTLVVHSVPPPQYANEIAGNPTLWPIMVYYGTYQSTTNLGAIYISFPDEHMQIVTPRVYDNEIVERKNAHNKLNSSSLSEIKGYPQKMDMWSWAAIYQSLSQYYYFQLPNGNPNKTLQQCTIVNNFYKELTLERGFDCCSIDDGSAEFTFCDMLAATADDITSLLKTNLNLTSRKINGDSLTSLMIINQIQNNRPVILGLSSNQLHYAMVTGYIRSTPQESNTETLLFKIWDPAIGNFQYSTLSEYNGLPEFLRKDPLIPNLNQAIIHPNNPQTIDFENFIPTKYSIEYALFVTP